MHPSLEEVSRFAEMRVEADGEKVRYGRVAVMDEMMADRCTPIEMMRILRKASRHCFLLESADHEHRWSRYSFLGCDPMMEIVCSNGVMRITRGADASGADAADGGADRTDAGAHGDDANAGAVVETFEVEHPADEVRKILERYRSPEIEGMPPLSGGLVGYFSYEYQKYSEPCLDPRNAVSARELEDCGFRDMDLMMFDQVIAYDHNEQKIKLVAGVDLLDPRGVEVAYESALCKIAELRELIERGDRIDFEPLHIQGSMEPRFSEEEYCEMVQTARHHIHEGDIFQVVLSNSISAPATGSLFDTYRVLRTTNASPYMFYFSSDDVEIAGSSPETLANLRDGVLHTFPLAGTRPRGGSPEEDARLEAELLADEKELSEHNMLVDLGRNDLGRVSEVGTVEVEDYLKVHRYSHVMHIGSTVRGQLDEGKDALDAVDSILPAGTLSGAPKVRACQIIQQLEGRTRGVYGGAIGYLDFSGNLDTCIGIRLAYMKNGSVCVQAGAGIVADSVPESEYRECLNKARAVLSALETSEGGVR